MKTRKIPVLSVPSKPVDNTHKLQHWHQNLQPNQYVLLVMLLHQLVEFQFCPYLAWATDISWSSAKVYKFGYLLQIGPCNRVSSRICYLCIYYTSPSDSLEMLLKWYFAKCQCSLCCPKSSNSATSILCIIPSQLNKRANEITN